VGEVSTCVCVCLKGPSIFANKQPAEVIRPTKLTVRTTICLGTRPTLGRFKRKPQYGECTETPSPR